MIGWPLVLWGCTAVPTLELERSEAVTTTFQASWEPTGEAWVEYGHEEAFDRLADGEGEATLWALRPESLVQARLCDEAGCGEAVEVETGAVPDWVPAFTGTASSGGSTSPLLLTLAALDRMALVVDVDGTPLWWDRAEAEAAATATALLDPDRDAIHYNVFNALVADETTFIREVGLDGEVLEDLELPGSHHDFVLHEDGTLAWLAYDEAEVDGETIRGDRIVERSPDGEERTVWSSWDTLDYRDSDVVSQGEFLYWTLGNALLYEEGRYLASLRGLNSVVAVEADSGELSWTFGRGGDFTLDTERWPVGQHHMDVVEDGFLLFDNSAAAAGPSRVVRYRLDEEALTASEVWSYTSAEASQAIILGDVDLLESGNVLVTWSQDGRIEEVTTDGDVLRELETVEGYAIGYVEVLSLD